VNIKKLINRTNGWQRLWVVLTSLGLLYFSGWKSWEASVPLDWQIEERYKIEEDFKNPACKAYAEKQLTEINPPEWDQFKSTCWHIYIARDKKQGVSYSLPYTLKQYEDDVSELTSYRVKIVAFKGLVIVLISSALTYVLGLLCGWVMSGFRK
jgi:hypothetical protein